MSDTKYPISQSFHDKYYTLYDHIVIVTLKDSSVIEGCFNDEFFEDEAILVSGEEVNIIKISDIEKMELSPKD